MRAFGILLLVLIISLLSSVRADPAYFDVCPLESLGETTIDCPWAMIARRVDPILEANPDPKIAAPKVAYLLSAIAPDYIKRLETEGRLAGKAKSLWGRSINFDEGAKAIIIPEALIDVILAKAGVSPRTDRIVNAGFEHTYGYLLSNLKTPYGFKRLRWVRPDIENGFGLEHGAISPTPKAGGLFMNVTHFAGRIAFKGKTRGDRAARKILRKSRGVAESIRGFPYENLHGRRLTETVKLADGRTIELRTDFVPFTHATGETTGGNTELLVYSVQDSAVNIPYLITAFPIAKGFSDGALNPKNLGDAKPITSRYNAFVSGLTDTKTPLTGKREASTF